MHMAQVPPRLAAVIAAYEGLRPDTLPALVALYHPEAGFKDPFNDVRGHQAIERIYRHMFATLEQPRFRVRDALGQGDHAFLTWDFSFVRQASGQVLTIHGATHLRFHQDGRITMHRDYWDAAQELYAKLPMIGALMRWLQRRLGADPGPK